MARPAPVRIGRNPSALRRNFVPVISTMIGSIATLLPLIMTFPIIPPLGLLMLLAWRALHRHIWPAWAGVLLGAWDDAFSGAIMGTSMLMWTLILIGYDIIDRRMMWREFLQDWALAAAVITLAIIIALALAGSPAAAVNPVMIVPQVIISILIFPLVTRLCSHLDDWRLR